MELKKIVVVLSICLGFYSYSQNNKIDSLKNIIQFTKIDTLKVEAYNAIARSFWSVNWDSARYYTDKSYNLALKINDKKSIIINLINLATYEEIKGDFKKSNEVYSIVENKLNKNPDNKLLASYYYNYGNLKYAEGKTDEAKLNYYIAISYYSKFKKYSTIAKIKDNIALIYTFQSKQNEAIKIYLENLKIHKKANNNLGISITYCSIGLNYASLKEYDKAILYFKKSEEVALKYKFQEQVALSNLNLGSAYGEKKEYHVAENYFKRAKTNYKKAGVESGQLKCDINYCELLVEKNEVEKAYRIINTIDFSKIQKATDYINANKIKGICLTKMNKDGMFYFKEAYEVTLQTKLNNQLPEIVSLLLESHFKNKNDNEGLKYFKEYDSLIKIENEISNKQSFFNLETKYQTSEKESQIKTQQLQIEQEKTNKYMAFGGIGFLILLSGGGYYWNRNKQNQKNLKTQNTLLGLQQNLMEAELSNLNKQLDPHEIKNLLASISPEIQDKAPESYKKMLKLFNLTKASLNSSSITESLENQLHQIDDFLSLEKSMLSIPLEYTIVNNIENTQTQIPRLLLKNLVENSIKHGIKKQETGGEIKIVIEEKDNFIYLTVDDTGKGRLHAISLDSGIGTSTYQKLFATLNPKNKEKASFEIIDKQQGTKVEVKIPTNYKYD